MTNELHTNHCGYFHWSSAIRCNIGVTAVSCSDRFDLPISISIWWLLANERENPVVRVKCVLLNYSRPHSLICIYHVHRIICNATVRNGRVIYVVMRYSNFIRYHTVLLRLVLFPILIRLLIQAVGIALTFLNCRARSVEYRVSGRTFSAISSPAAR